MISSYLSNESQLDDRAIHLLFSANRWEKRALMERKLKRGTTLIVDRYSYSGVAFSAAKGLDLQWCKAPEEGLIAPDLVLYLDIPPEKAAERGGYGTDRYEKLEFRKKVVEYYYALRNSSWENIQFNAFVITICLIGHNCQKGVQLQFFDVQGKKFRELAMNCILKCQN
ncbi:hypothetical protein LUZ61_013507 [Rhynchospora tenuis]|uniref:dTMP kinase n=1 Tax=Rhynchospora tenuis TaxID=198213 RepID=A0AAD5WAP3_9POAL|nr:hypothetical protein LUZ61_013507 [Rhynchospora tenuis]